MNRKGGIKGKRYLPALPSRLSVERCPACEDHTRGTGQLGQSWGAQCLQSPTENPKLVGKS